MLKLITWIVTALRPVRMQRAYAFARVAARRPELPVLMCALTLVIASGTAQAQVPDSKLHELGLQTMWRAQLQLPLQNGGIVSMHLWTNPSIKKSFVELTLPSSARTTNRTLRINPDMLGEDGKPIGVDAAKKELETRGSRILGRPTGLTPVDVTLPMIYLIVVTSDGHVQAFDAESGDLAWRANCGSVLSKASPASVSDFGVVVAQGEDLFVLDLKTGKQTLRKKLARASSAGVALVDSVAFVASLSGQIQAFDLAKPSHSPWTFRLFGRSVLPPTNSDRTHQLVAFATENGTATVLSGGEKIGPWFNVKAQGSIAGPMKFIGGALYVGDTSGQILKVGLDRLGRIEWRMLIGEPLSSPPLLVEKSVYAANEVGELFAADDTTGYLLWEQPAQRVRSVLAGSKQKLYCRSLTGRLMVIDAANGDLLGETGVGAIGYDLVNQLNDRLYVVSPNGMIQCVRESGNEHLVPSFHEPLPPPKQEKPKTTEPVVPSTENAEMENADPFGTGSTEPAAAPAGDDPFGAAQPSPF